MLYEALLILYRSRGNKTVKRPITTNNTYYELLYKLSNNSLEITKFAFFYSRSYNIRPQSL